MIAVAAVALAVSGCQSAASRPPTVNMSLVAPTSGATVYVRTIVVLGRVNPADANVLVAGRRARVRDGVFRLRVRLPGAVNHIGILAFAPGFRAQSVNATVRVGTAVSSAPPPSHSSPKALPSDFGARGAAICSAAIQREQALPKPATVQELVTVAREYLAIMADKNRQLFALAAPYRRVPGVQQFLSDLRAKIEQVRALFRDLLDGRQQAASQVARQNTVDAPRYWQDAGRLGMPNCGAVWVPVGG